MIRFLKRYYPVRNVLFFILEGMIIFSSFQLSVICLTIGRPFFFTPVFHLKILMVTGVCLSALYYQDLYEINAYSTFKETLVKLVMALGTAAVTLGLIYWLFPFVILETLVFSLAVVFVLIFVVSWRMLFLYVLDKGLFNEKIIVLGSSALAMDIVEEIQSHLDCGYQVEALIPDGTNTILQRYVEAPLYRLSDTGRLCQVVEQMGVNRIVVALKDKRGRFPSQDLLTCRIKGIEVIEGVNFYEGLTGKILVREMRPSGLIFSEGFRPSWFSLAAKRMADLIFSGLMLVVLLPVWGLLALAVKLDSRGPVFYAQERVGQYRQPYRMYKFRSMAPDAEARTGPVWARQDDMRVTRVGRFIRRFRLDELPQLWNVFKGEMSLVGPRPERPHFVEQLEKEVPYYVARLEARPGITGWAQILYDYGASVEDAVEKLGYDLFYIKHLSFLLDATIMLRTVKAVLFGRGVR